MMEQNQEQLETQRLKQFWQKYGNVFTSIVLIILLVLVGWQYWQRREIKLATQASTLYETLLVSYANHNTVQVEAYAKQIIDDFSRTPYATMAAFLLAKQAVEQNQLPIAITKLQWIISHTHNSSFKAIARIRLARILLATQQINPALETIEAVTEKNFLFEAYTIKADILVAQKNFATAKTTYQQALALMPKESPLYAYVEMKLNNL